MKKLVLTLSLALALTMQAAAITVNQAAGTFKGLLNVGGTQYPNREVYILPGIESNTVTFVLPDFTFNNAPLGDIVLVNIPMNSAGQLTLTDRTLYIKAIQERASVTMLQNVQDGGTTYNSVITTSSAQVLLSILAPSVPEPIMVLFEGNKVTGDNYALTNGGFEGSWSNNEPNGWHSFKTATGSLASMISGNTEQFEQSSDKRPGSTGSYSAKLRSNLTMGVKANGNCTNGRINAGSTTADDASGNYNFSDPSNNGYNTPFVGNPDSIVFWSKYIPADQNPSNSVNKARMHTVITTNARYQDPENSDYSSVKVAEATVNYAATSSMGWQRLAVPFNYTNVNPDNAAYVLVTFTTNMTPGGGSTYSTGSIFNKKYYYDNVYIDDVEMVYNHALTVATMNGNALTFNGTTAQSPAEYSDALYDFAVQTDGRAAQSFIGYDEANLQAHIYVVADNYSQAQAYSVYTVQMAAPTTYYAYQATTCDNEPYSDDLFTNLTAAGEYTDTILNHWGGDSIVTLTLGVLPTYASADEASIYTVGSYEWQGRTYTGLAAGVYYDTLSLLTVSQCDSLLTLALTVVETPTTYGEYEIAICQGDSVEYEGTTYRDIFDDNVLISQPNVYGGDSIVHLIIHLLPTYLTDSVLTITVGDAVMWEETDLSTFAVGDTTLTASYQTVDYCDSTLVLHLTVEPRSIVTGLDNAAGQNAQVRKCILNGRLYIIRDEEMFTVIGEKIEK